MIVNWRSDIDLSSFMKRFFNLSSSADVTVQHSQMSIAEQKWFGTQNAQLDRFCMSSMNCDAVHRGVSGR